MNSPKEEIDLTDPMEKMVFTLTGMTVNERKRCKARSIKFPPKLMYVLECDHYADVVTWDPSGYSFIIIDSKAFEERVLPEIFKEAKFSSFQRKLVRWSFIKAGKDNSYAHPDFQRGEWVRCFAMKSDNRRGHEKKFKQRLQTFRQQSGASLQHQVPLSTRALPQCAIMPRIPSVPSLSSSLVTSDASSVYTTNSSLGSYSHQGLAPQGFYPCDNTFSENRMLAPTKNSIYSHDGHCVLGLGSKSGPELEQNVLHFPNIMTSVHSAASCISLPFKRRSQLLRITGSTEDEILKNAYKTLRQAP